MKIFVVSLTRATERRAHIASMMQENALRFEFFDAIDAKEANKHADLFAKYSEEKRIQLRGSPLQIAEIACFASHYSLWKKCVQLNEPIVILEDDCFLKAEFAAINTLIKKCLNIKQDALIRLYYTRNNIKAIDIQKLNDAYTLQRCMSITGGTVGYAVSPIAAQMLIDGAKYFTDTVDDYLDREGLHSVHMLGVYPNTITHMDEMETTIGDRSVRMKIPLIAKVRRESIRLVYDSKTLINRFKFILSLPNFRKKLKAIMK